MLSWPRPKERNDRGKKDGAAWERVCAWHFCVLPHIPVRHRSGLMCNTHRDTRLSPLRSPELSPILPLKCSFLRPLPPLMLMSFRLPNRARPFSLPESGDPGRQFPELRKTRASKSLWFFVD